ncbi:MAG TPA: anhydro-N-acetylmuramic acid kinase [Myxococcales bacterium]|nr:anhydro-N-acetylmuramic acid kinase [Myxococcales bacterium]HIL02019.1 anhydro-N-acetylmuramic acid kinase [Myxococcales bacterium]
MLVIGLMSGTSADAVDAALVEWPGGTATRPFLLRAYRELPLGRSEQARVHALAAGEVDSGEAMRELIDLDRILGERFAEAAMAVADAAGVPLDDIDGIASHGQTIAHHPEVGGTLQIGSLALIAERTGCRVIGDFRPGDMAAGGQGAPLAPFFHHAAFAVSDENRLILNLGGIANITWLPAAGDLDRVVAFDVGPANSLVDGVVELITEGAEAMDRDGARGLRGTVSQTFLSELLRDEYLSQAPPKSTGRERYGRARSAEILAEWRSAEPQSSEDDLLATLVAFTAEGVARACRDWLPGWKGVGERVLVGGGGAASPGMMAGLRTAFPDCRIDAFDPWGVPADAAEAMAFSLLGRNTLLGLPNHIPQCTGASRLTVLGAIVGSG